VSSFSEADPADKMRIAAGGLAVDAVAAEVVSALRAQGVEPILLRGPALARLLYADGVRAYGDVDLLVEAAAQTRAQDVLVDIGFEASPNVVHFRPAHASAWRRSGGVNVDLHHTLVGVGRPSKDVWELLSAQTESLSVGGIEIAVLNPAAAALQVALHAAQHGVGVKRPLRDLELAVALLSAETWSRAAAFADSLEATEAFAAGLRLLPAGAHMADQLDLPRQVSAEIALRARTPPPVSRGIMRLTRTRGFRAKARLLGRELVPEPVFLRRHSALARRGRLGLAITYLYRPFWLLWHLLPGLRAWRHAQREAGRRGSETPDRQG
jgi:hypothetical protein